MSNYVDTRTKIKVQCNICGKVYYTLPTVISGGSMCKNCSNRKSHEEFVEEMRNINNNINIIGKYIKDDIKVFVECKICGHKWDAHASHLLQGHGCPKCARKQNGINHRVNSEVILKMIEETNPDIEVIGKLGGIKKKVEVKSKICGHTWHVSPENVIRNNTGCPICKTSHGEKLIYITLKEKSIAFIYHKYFDDLFGVGGGYLSYDFYLPNYNLLIEFQGIQHEKPIDFSGRGVDFALNQFEIQQEHDKRKREYAYKHNIDLLEIWYCDYENIKQILYEKLNINNNQKSA